MTETPTAPPEAEPYPLWSPACPFPPADEMPDLDVVTHVAVERAVRGEFHYLHESALAWHKGALYLCWANHPLMERNVKEELIRGTRSLDGGFTWEAPEVWAQPGPEGAESCNHPVLASHAGRLWGFFTHWRDEAPATDIFVLDEAGRCWTPTGASIPGLIPFRPPLKMRDGNWIIGGEETWREPAVAVSQGDDFTSWRLVRIPRPADMELLYPEVTLMDLGERLVAICRPRLAGTAPVSVSDDRGRSWTPLRFSNFPLASSQPYCGKLSTGQHYLVTNNREEGRTLLSIAVTRPGGDAFERVWKVRHQQFPKRRLFGGWGGATQAGRPTEWSYPAAVERDGNLYISYTHGKEDCALSIVPVSVLAI